MHAALGQISSACRVAVMHTYLLVIILSCYHGVRACRVWFHARFLIPTKRRDMSPLRLKVYHLCHHPWFGHAATICVVINTLVFAVQFADEPETYTMVLEKINMGGSYGTYHMHMYV